MLVLYKMICVINSNIQIRCSLVDKTLTDLFGAMLLAQGCNKKKKS